MSDALNSLVEGLNRVIHQNTRTNDLHCIDEEQCKGAVKEYLRKEIIQLPKVVGFDDYHDIASTFEVLKQFHPNLPIQCRESEFMFGKYWGVFFLKDAPPSLEQIYELVKDVNLHKILHKKKLHTSL